MKLKKETDLKDLSITEDDAGVLPLPLRNVLDLDVDRFETRFQSGNVVKYVEKKK